MQSFNQFSFLSRLNGAAKWWLGLLVALLIGQIVMMSSIGLKGRDAIKNRVEKTESRLLKEGVVFENEEQRQGKVIRSIKLNEYISSGLWYGAAVGAGIVSLLILSIMWWGKGIKASSQHINFPSRRILFWILGIMLIGTTLRLPRMELSLYNDESFAFRRFIHGSFKNDTETGELKFHKHSWKQTIWGNIYGNNGAFYSILARAGHDAWQKTTGALDGQVGESALRLPSLIAGSASIVVIGLLGYICSGARASIVAALLTALHPWHLRYSTEARPYGIVIFLAAFILLALILAIREGRWRWWILFGIAQLLCLWAYLGSIYFLVPVNLIALAWMVKSERDRIPRWFVANVVGAMLFLQVILPALPQIYQSLSTLGVFKGTTRFNDTVEIIAYLLSGMPLENNAPTNPWSPAWQNIGVAGSVVFWGVGAVFLFGFIKLLFSRNANVIFVSSIGVGAVFFAIVMSNITEAVNHHWYLIYALPSFILIMAMTIDSLWRSRYSYIGPGLLSVLVASFGFPFLAYSKQSKEQLHEIALQVHGDVYPFAEAPNRPLFAAFWSDTLYDPTLIYTPTLSDLKKAMERSRFEKRPLFVEFGHRKLALRGSEEGTKGLVNFIEDSGKFELVKIFYGLEKAQFTHYLYRLKDEGE